MSRLQSSGTLWASDINGELRRPWNAPFSLADGLTQQLARHPGGQLNWSQFHGAQLYVDAGTYLGQYCFGTTLFYNYADGNGGSGSRPVEYNSPTCGYVAPPPPPPPPPTQNYPSYGSYISEYCAGNQLIGVYADGNGGSYTTNFGAQPACGGGVFEGG